MSQASSAAAGGFVRVESAVPNARGAYPGLFALVNGLARSGALSPAEHAWWRSANAWYDAAYPDPALVDPSLFDRSLHPLTSCWFRADAVHLLARVPGYTGLLDRHGVAWAERRSADPGPVLYADAVQVVVADQRFSQEIPS